MPPPLRILFCLLSLGLIFAGNGVAQQTSSKSGTNSAGTQSPPRIPEQEPSWLQAIRSEEKALTSVIEKMPTSLGLFSRRGDARVFLGEYTGAVADYEAMISIDQAQDAPHWRLGIAYYFNGQFSKAASQFEKYHAFDGRDRENGVWKFFSQAKVDGVEKARKEMLVYTRFDREPFPSIYAMLAGTMSPEALLKEVSAKGLENDSRVVFFAKYYAGIHHTFTGKREDGLRLVKEAVALFSPDSAGRDGPGYMWHSARLHAAQLEAELHR